MKLEIVPCNQAEAKAFVAQYHRHHKPPLGSIFQLACSDGEKVVGVAIVGSPAPENPVRGAVRVWINKDGGIADLAESVVFVGDEVATAWRIGQVVWAPEEED